MTVMLRLAVMIVGSGLNYVTATRSRKDKLNEDSVFFLSSSNELRLVNFCVAKNSYESINIIQSERFPTPSKERSKSLRKTKVLTHNKIQFF